MLFGRSGGGDDYELIVLLLLLLALSHRSVSTANEETDCWKGPDFWCFNRTSEDQCSFATKSIGVCAYSNRRCPVRTGTSVRRRNRDEFFLCSFVSRRRVLSGFVSVGVAIQRRFNWRRRWTFLLLHAQFVLATVELSVDLQQNARFSPLLLFAVHRSRSAGQRTFGSARPMANVLHGRKLSRLAAVLHRRTERLVQMSRQREFVSVGQCEQSGFHSGRLRILLSSRRRFHVFSQRQ